MNGGRRSRMDHHRVSSVGEPINLFDFEELARQRLPRTAFDYFSSGAHDEVTLRENRAAFERLSLSYRVLTDVATREHSTTVLGRRQAMPVMIAPTAFASMANPGGEVAVSRAAAATGTTMVLSMLATCSIEEVAQAANGPRWFQLYVFRDRRVTKSLVERAQAAGYQALVLTVDAPFLGRRERDVRNRFQLPDGMMAKNLLPVGLQALPTAAADSGLAAYFSSMLDQSLTWKDVDWLRSISRLPVLVKGVVRADDARRALEHGAAGVIVSNHGGRQLDTAPASIDALPAVARAVGSRMEVLVDGGIRRGTDIIKALALGARAVLVGRPIIWGLAVGGEQGVREVLEILRSEFDLAMALCGCASVREISEDLIVRRP